MRRIYKSMIWVSVLALSAGAVSAQKAERKNVREGNKLYESEKYTESEIAYRKSLEVNPRSTEPIIWGIPYTSKASSPRPPSNIN